MSQTDDDKQQVAQDIEKMIKREVLEQLKLESINEEVAKEPQGANAGFSFSQFAQHPAFLVIVGFVLTGIVGNLLLSYWQQREWERQQIRLVQIRGIEQKYAVIDEIAKAIGEHNSAAQNVVVVVLRDLDDNTRLNSELPELSKGWDTARRDWRGSSSILKQKLIVYFKNKEARELFESIRDLKRRMNVDLSAWLADLNSRNLNQLNSIESRSAQAEEHVRTVSQLTDETSGKFEQMAGLLVKDIQGTVER